MSKNLHFIRADAEKIQFNTKLDAITCQYALFFFPNEQKVLKNMKKVFEGKWNNYTCRSWKI